ncbi:MAG TPA: VCBS repeat-containing protein, partial [bacterium]|nr:VCBS repeat-containing protein [bacterium]
MRWNPQIVLTVLGCVGLSLACGRPVQDQREPGFYDITAATGITFVHTDGSSGRHYLVETVTAGLGLFDYDNDGDLDIYFVNGADLPGQTSETPPTNELWRNDGEFRFTNVTREAGVGDTGYGMGCVMGDIDNDGYLDIYVSNFREDVLYRNNGDGTFTDTTASAGLGDPRLGAGACMADFNQDGWLDIFVANYIECPLDTPAPCTRLGVP